MEETPLDAMTYGVGEFLGHVLGARRISRRTLWEIARAEAARERSRSVQMFIEECVGVGLGISCAALFRHYRAWGTHLVPHHTVSAVQFEAELRAALPAMKRDTRLMNGRRAAVYVGVTFNPDPDTAAYLEEVLGSYG